MNPNSPTLCLAERLLESDPFIKGRVAISEAAYREAHQGRSMDDNMRRVLAVTLHNTWEAMQQEKFIPAGQPMNEKYLREDTFSSNVAKFVPYAFDVITALLPNLIIDEIASIQPMDRRTGEIYYLDFKRGIGKGQHAAGELALDAQRGAFNNGQAYDGEYTTDDSTETAGTGDGATTVFAGSLGYVPVIPSTVEITTVAGGNDQVVNDDGAGALIGDGTGTVNYTTGAYSITFTTAPDLGEPIYFKYQIDQERNPDAVGTLELELRSEVVTARRHAMRLRLLMDAEWDLQKAHGKDAGQELLAEAMNEIKREIEIRYLNMLWTQATNSATPDSFDAAQPTIGVTLFDHYRSIKNRFSSNSYQILADTQRAAGNFLVVGTGTATILATIGEPDYKSMVDMANPPAGPHLAGVLSGRWRVIVNPAPEWRSRVLIGHKGESYLQAGSIWAPYRPIVVTQRVALDDFKYRQGILSYSAQKMINARMFRQLVVQNAP